MRTKFVTFCLIFALAVVAKAQSISVEGTISAFKKVGRCPTCLGKNGQFGTQVENWLVRIDAWPSGSNLNAKYVLVEYQMIDRSLTNDELRTRLSFMLLSYSDDPLRRLCAGVIYYKHGKQYYKRSATIEDYQFVNEKQDSDTPRKLSDLPCFTVDHLPVIVEE